MPDPHVHLGEFSGSFLHSSQDQGSQIQKEMFGTEFEKGRRLSQQGPALLWFLCAANLLCARHSTPQIIVSRIFPSSGLWASDSELSPSRTAEKQWPRNSRHRETPRHGDQRSSCTRRPGQRRLVPAPGAGLPSWQPPPRPTWGREWASPCIQRGGRGAEGGRGSGQAADTEPARKHLFLKWHEKN